MSTQSICYLCRGAGTRKKKVRGNEGKWQYITHACPPCNGTGNITRKKKQHEDGSWKKKRIAQSYPSFAAPGPHPLGSQDKEHLTVRDDEELSYLVGHWRIFQRLGRHRYSTDDLVTTWIACKEAVKYGYTSPRVLDIGCGLGSVLLMNAWQLPTATCVGIEAQEDRYALALRSIEYNVGAYPQDQKRIRVINADLRDASDAVIHFLYHDCPEQSGFDMITGTPPYFPPGQGAAPSCGESNGCLFELRGGVEAYCESAARHLRQPNGATDELPSFFVLCNTALASARVYSGCMHAGLSVIRRIDVVPREGKPALFCVFVVVADSWITRYPHLFPVLTPHPNPLPEPLDMTICPSHYRINESMRGEVVESICVRDKALKHTHQYQALLRDLGKPSTADKEEYNLDLIADGDQKGVSTSEIVVEGTT